MCYVIDFGGTTMEVHLTFFKNNLNYKIIKHDLIGDTHFINYGGITTLFNGAMISAKNAVISRSITGSGSTSLVKISNNTTLNWGGSLNGNLEYCDANGIENSYGTVNAPAVFSCNVYIPSTSCNSIGNGIQLL